jgi:diacylglycerol kinase family enzyme
METIGTGKGIAALFNARAKQVNVRTVRAFQKALPDALVLVSEDFSQARRHAARIAHEKPDVVMAGGGDGSIARLLNMLREAGQGWFPVLGLLKLGTGNAWANVAGARGYLETVRALPAMPRPLPTQTFNLVEVENTLCPFAGVGWDARLLNDYLRNLDKRSSQLIGSRIATRIHKGLGGYLYSLFRITIPEEVALLWKEGQPRVVLENLGPEVFTLDSQARPILLREGDGHGVPRVLYEGPVSVGAASTIEEWGFGFRAFPFARAVPGYINVRVYDKPALHATRNMMKLWRGEYPRPGMHDFYVKRVAMRFSRPMPFQIAGDGEGTRDRIEYRVADETIQVVDWPAAFPPA